MNILSVAAVCILVCVAALTVKQIKPELAVLISLCVVCVLAWYAVLSLSPVTELINNIAQITGTDEKYFKAVLKAVGICILTQIASDICTGAGENAVATGVELCGRVAVLITAVPLISEVISTAADIAGG